jgi:hypothetical protein
VAGGFDTEQEAALAYDVACVRFRGSNAQTNFDIDGYTFELDHIDEVPSPPLPSALPPRCTMSCPAKAAKNHPKVPIHLIFSRQTKKHDLTGFLCADHKGGSCTEPASPEQR